VVLSNNRLLEEVYLGQNKLQTSGLKVLKYGMKYLYHLKKFSINDNQLTEDAGESIADIVTNCTQLQQIALQNNCLNDAGIVKLSSALVNLSNLKLLHLGNNNITEQAADSIAEIIAISPLEDFDVGGNKRVVKAV